MSGEESRQWSRRAILAAAAAGGGTGVVGAITGDGQQGNLYGGKMALQEAYNVAGKLWIGPDSAKSNVSADTGRVYMASDTQVEYYGDSGGWVKLGVGSSTEPVPSVTTEKSVISREFDFTPGPDWNDHADRSGSNPLVTGTSNDSDQFYPPSVIRVDDTYYMVGKSGGDILGFQSSDRLSWSGETTVLSSGTKLTNPVLRYDSDTSTYHLYAALGSDIIHDTSSSPLSGFSTASATTVLQPSDIDGLSLGYGQWNDVNPRDLIYYNGEYILYGYATDFGGKVQTVLFRASGSSWDSLSADSILLYPDEHPVRGELLQGPNVIRTQGVWVYVFTSGQFDADVLDERRLYVGVGGPQSFDPVAETVLAPGSSGTWDERRTYLGCWLVEQDGEYLTPDLIDEKVQLFFSGHDLGTASGNTGLPGLAEYDGLPLSGLLKRERQDPAGPRAVLSSDWSHTGGGGDERIAFDTVTRDPYIEYQSSAEKMVAERDRTYNIDVKVEVVPAASGDVHYLKLFKNGTAIRGDYLNADDTDRTQMRIHGGVDLVPGDELEMFLNADGAATIKDFDGYTYFDVQ